MKNDKHPRVLIISDATWTDENNIGNTFSNLFEDWPKEKIAMIYARPDLPNTVVCDNFFQISENRLIRRLLNHRIKTGKKINTLELNNLMREPTFQNEENSGKKIYSFFLKFRWNIFLLAREILWKIGKWKTKELDNFIEDFKPEIVFSLACPGIYMNRLQQYAINHSKARSIVYFVDDVYSLKQFSFSPIFWLNRIMVRRSIAKTVKLSNLVYTIVPKQKYEYDKSFNIETKLLTKGGSFESKRDIDNNMQTPLKLIYTGNIYAGRWGTIERIGRFLDKINANDKKGIFFVYSKNELTLKMKNALSEIESIKFMGAIPASQVNEIQSKADILVHVESLSLKEKLLTRLSFSTKLVDYFAKATCILAIGWSKAASIEYLKENNIAVIIDDLKDLKKKMNDVFNNTELLKDYAHRSWEFGKKHHEISIIRKQLYKDITELYDNGK